MIDTSMYQTSGGFDQGLRAGQSMGQGIAGMMEDPLKIAMEKIKAGTPKEVVIAEMQKTNPEMAQKLIELLNGGAAGTQQQTMGIL
jgi:hypothetical protein